MAVHVEARPDFWSGGAADDVAGVLGARIKELIGVTARVVVDAPGAIERSLGKARRVIDHRPKE
jgi:phenylacetate-CoA ligase